MDQLYTVRIKYQEAGNLFPSILFVFSFFPSLLDPDYKITAFNTLNICQTQMKETVEIQTHSNSFPLLTIASLLMAIYCCRMFISYQEYPTILSLGHKELCFQKTNTCPGHEFYSLLKVFHISCNCYISEAAFK